RGGELECSAPHRIERTDGLRDLLGGLRRRGKQGRVDPLKRILYRAELGAALRVVGDRCNALQGDEQPFAALSIHLEQRWIVQHLEQLRAALHGSDLLKELLRIVSRFATAAHEGLALASQVADLGRADDDGQQQRHRDERKPGKKQAVEGFRPWPAHVLSGGKLGAGDSSKNAYP